MAPSDFSKADIPSIVEKLTLEDAIALIAGVGFWKTHEIPRFGIPAIKVSDGPNGVRGNHFFMGTPAKCLPSATALGATWDTNLIETVGAKLLAPEAKLRAASVILAPTCNIQRSPLGGRSFESFSEDPHLSGMIAAAYVRGVQSGGIGTTIKHFAGNDKEDDRMAYDSIISPRALREIYLMPFMLAEKYAQPWSYMTAYNRLNGTHLSEHPILNETLRGEWGSDAMIMSDWFGVYSVSESINAGLDLEMPGENKWRVWEKTSRSVTSRKIMARTIKERATKVLEFVQKCAKGAPEVLDGDGKERTSESPEDAALMRKVGAESIVLLKNDGKLLPLDATKLKKVAIVGGNAKAYVLSGGGSASLKPSFFVSPFDGIASALGKNVEVTYTEGARTFMTMPVLDNDLVTASGEKGWTGTWFNNGDDRVTAVGKPVATQVMDETNMMISNSAPEALTSKYWTLQLEGKLKPRDCDMAFEFGLTVAGRAKLYVDGALVIDNWTHQTRGQSFFGNGSAEEKGVVQLKRGQAYDVKVVFVNVRGPAEGDEDEALMDTGAGVRLGGAPVIDAEEEIGRAEALAKEADVAIVVVGLNADWETEGYDRTTLALPGRTDELVEKVCAANKNTIVITQSGSAITMPWKEQAPSIVHTWYLGNATGDSIADVLFGKVNPSGKLSLTFPKRLEDVPSYGHFHSEHGKIRYAEDLFVGYKHYQNVKTAPLWPFGFGLSYTSFTYSDLKISKPTTTDGKEISIKVSLKLTNAGSLAGSEVAQLYISHPTTSEVTHPPVILKAFKKEVDLKPGESRDVEFTLDKYAVSYWEERINKWTIETGEYGVKVGPASDDLPLVGTLVLGKSDVFEWNGL